MPVSRKRRKTTGSKAAAVGRRERAGQTTPRMIAPPWVVWRHAKSHDSEFATVVAHIPFRIGSNAVTLAQSAKESGLSIEDFVDHCYTLSEQGMWAWDEKAGTLTFPGYQRYRQSLNAGADEASAMRASRPTVEEVEAGRAQMRVWAH
jgi:hypothetical protein